MAFNVESENVPTIIASITAQQKAQNYDAAIEIIFDDSDLLFGHKDWQMLRAILDAFPASLSKTDPRILYVTGRFLGRTGCIDNAINCLQKSEIHFSQSQPLRAAKCCLELARLYHTREDFRTAYHWVHEAESHLSQAENEPLQADFLFRLAELCPDIGKLHESQTYAMQALEKFKCNGDVYGQFNASRLLAQVATQLGDYQETASRLEMARQYHRAGELMPELYVYILNEQTHLEWYKGNLAQALKCANELKEFADKFKLDQQKVYARILLGNIYRANGEFESARHWFAESHKETLQCGLTLFLVWVYFQQAWLELLDNRLPEATLLIHKALDTSDSGQAMSFNICLAVLNICKEQWESAETLLLRSLRFYAELGDLRSVSIIRLYLACICLKTERMVEADTLLEMAFQWCDQNSIDYFPHWWHPPIVSEICGYAVVTNIYPNVVERFFVKRLGANGVQVLRRLRNREDADVRKHIFALRTLIDDEVNELHFVKDEAVRCVLDQLLESGFLKKESFERLLNKLVTAERRKTHNPVLVAVFGLYLRDLNNKKIAQELQISESSVKQYINKIYHIFQVKAPGSTLIRKNLLHQKSKEQGFI